MTGYRLLARHPGDEAFLRRFLEIVHLAENQGRTSVSAFLDFWRELGDDEKVPQPENVAAVRVMRSSLDVGKRPYLFTGRADRLDRRGEGVIILDYKTGSLAGRKSLPWDDEAFFGRLGDWKGEDDGLALLQAVGRRCGSVQLPLYCWLYAATAGEVPADAAYVELRESGAERPLFGARSDSLAREDAVLRRTPAILGFLLRHITATAAFAPRPDARRCAFCDFRPACGAV